MLLSSHLPYISSRASNAGFPHPPHCISFEPCGQTGRLLYLTAFPFKQQLPIRSIYFIQTFQNTPQICHKSEGGLYIFLLASIIYLLYIRTVSPPRRVFESPTRYQFSSISIRTGTPYIPYLHIKAVSTMQSPIIGFNTKPDIISSHRWIINQSTYLFSLILLSS